MDHSMEYMMPRGLNDILGSFLNDDGSSSTESPHSSTASSTAMRVAKANATRMNDSRSAKDILSVTPEIIDVVLIAVLLGIFILATVIGNVFVITAILLEKNLQSVANYLVLSLAVADLMVACLVMPLGAVYEVSGEWLLGPALCEVWTCCDVLCCTASILHLVAIAVDRYRSITHVDYTHSRNARHIGMMIFLVWAVACVVSFGPLFGWKDSEFLNRIEEEKRCMVSQDVSYQIFATCATFYVPLTVILILYWRIYREAKKRIRFKPGAKATLVLHSSPARAALISHSELTQPDSPEPSTANDNDSPTTDKKAIMKLQVLVKKEKKCCRETIEAKRERKAAKTLMIITGVFLCCWLPFFVMALLMAICPACAPSELLFSFFLWLGYVNSMLNPIIYTIFSPDFRLAFKRILCGSQSTMRRPV